MRLLIALLAAAGLAGLSGCVAYGGGVYGASDYYGPGYGPTYGTYSYYNATPQYYGRRDSDGDGVPNRYDRRPYDPHRY
jgi:hypothetical protein